MSTPNHLILSDRDSSGIVIFGPVGVGKSRLAPEAIAAAASHGYETRCAGATSAGRYLAVPAAGQNGNYGELGSFAGAHRGLGFCAPVPISRIDIHSGGPHAEGGAARVAST